MSQVKLNYELDMTEDSVWLTVTPGQAVKSSLIYIQELGDFISGAKYYTRRENLPSYLIKYTVSGEGELDYGGKHYEVKPGQIIWIDCMNPQYYCTSPRKGNWHIIWVHFYGANCEAYYNLFMAQNRDNNCVHIGNDIAVKSALEALIAIYQSEDNSIARDVQANGLLTTILTRCITAAVESRRRQNIPISVMDARDYINLNYMENISLDVLSKKLSINKYYLQKLFKRHMGVSPNEYLIQTRLTQAKIMLRTTNASVNQISLSVGNANVGHFIHTFKQHEGITPSVYRQRWHIAKEEK